MFYQQTGEYRYLRGGFKNSVVKAELVDAEIQPTTTYGWLTFNSDPATAPFLEVAWQPADHAPAQPAKFQRVATMWRRERAFHVVEGLSVGVSEAREYPVFSKSWRMDDITRTLDQNWWSKDPGHPESRFQREMDSVKSWFVGHADESVNAVRETAMLFVSGPLVTLSSESNYDDHRSALAEEHLTSNFVKEGSHYRQFELADIFRRGTPWNERLATLSRQHFGKSLPDSVNLKQLTAADMKQFAVLPAGLLIRFQPFASPADGLPHVLVPWSQLRDLIDPHGPARYFVTGAKTTTGK